MPVVVKVVASIASIKMDAGGCFDVSIDKPRDVCIHFGMHYFNTENYVDYVRLLSILEISSRNFERNFFGRLEEAKGIEISSKHLINVGIEFHLIF